GRRRDRRRRHRGGRPVGYALTRVVSAYLGTARMPGVLPAVGAAAVPAGAALTASLVPAAPASPRDRPPGLSAGEGFRDGRQQEALRSPTRHGAAVCLSSRAAELVTSLLPRALAGLPSSPSTESSRARPQPDWPSRSQRCSRGA